jgi:hypothetical protein
VGGGKAAPNVEASDDHSRDRRSSIRQ